MTTPHTPSPGDSPAPDALERRLTALSDWRDGAEPTLYAQALRATRKDASTDALHDEPARADVAARLRRPRVLVPALAAAVLAVAAAAQLWFGGAVRSYHVAPSTEVGVPVVASPQWKSLAGQGDDEKKLAVDRADLAAADAALAERSVIRKASIEIQSHDVRADFARAGLLVNDALGEFIESSSLTGDGPAAQGVLTLRVTAARLNDVLNELRALGTVASEKSGGEDVTAQAVDLDARLRNERKVEDELLKLLESRKSAPLKEILDLRDQLAKVRERIEQMTAQQDKLGKSVSLATILVILRAEPAPPAEAEQSRRESALDYFARQLDGAWRAGTRALADSAAGIVRALVGGLVWWALLAAIMIACLRWTREARRRAMGSVAPAI